MITIQKIKNYDKIDVSLKNTLLVLDIDETIIKFPNINQKWWDDNYGEQYKIHEIKKARDIVLKKWINIINKFKPIMLDKEKFDQMINKSNKLNHKIIFLTARIPELNEITKKNLSDCEIDYYENNLYHLPYQEPRAKNKGQIIREVVNQLDNIENIIFVDDMMHNMESVINEFIHDNDECIKYNLHLYLMDHENLD